jgi:hypothetical protein
MCEFLNKNNGFAEKMCGHGKFYYNNGKYDSNNLDALLYLLSFLTAYNSAPFAFL